MNETHRINASMLAENIGRMVCFVGTIKEVNPKGDKLQLLSSDKKTVNIALPDKYEDSRGCIEVIGIVQPDLSIVAERYIAFNEDDFDAEAYNLLIVKFMPKFTSLTINRNPITCDESDLQTTK
ncbi:replication protein A 14 kDa subunit-like [Xenia sp. Carnegie-2017]|uniref:replication protein A 14 kDa subunit-like n=1 Tax=Xenia sp. Carnegie-2017 TaxID=2897299 RepID=UPI001F0436CD|nr:replication protein A 14 kDa subunit-like [Xenia sp. Carnegie-2017]